MDGLGQLMAPPHSQLRKTRKPRALRPSEGQLLRTRPLPAQRSTPPPPTPTSRPAQINAPVVVKVITITPPCTPTPRAERGQGDFRTVPSSGVTFS